MGKSCLITGGAGFVGSNLIRHLASRGMRLRVLDNLSAGRAADLGGTDAELLIGDIRDTQLVEQAVQGMETVIHLAAHTNVIESIKTPEVNLEVNVKGTFNLLQASVKYGVKRFVFASTGGAIIGEADPPVHEDMAPHPISPYGAGKLAGEGYCSAFWGSYGLKSICLRFSNVYGPFSYHKGSVIAKFFRRVQVGEPVTVYGDGAQTRDFIYVGDLEKAIVSALQIEDLPFGEAIQLGTGKETSINELVVLMRKVVGEGIFPSLVYQPSRPGEVLRNYVSIARANQYLSFVPATTLEEGLKETWRWFKQES
ncbi:MAG: NAD-dependent epimerase/dehydratase family protein [Syntrophobacterales bacterium]|jgi:UDP-glucose 4-epimerase|nr:NAD-dependent epimerase/dehydratase family protein [Syntrophobacterales bacterium]